MQSIQHEGLYQGQILTNRYQVSSLFSIYSFEPHQTPCFQSLFFLKQALCITEIPSPLFFSIYKCEDSFLTSIISPSLLTFLMCDVGLLYCIFTILQFSKNKDNCFPHDYVVFLILITERYTRWMIPLRYSYRIHL